MQDRIEIVAANEFCPTPEVIRAVVEVLDRLLKHRLNTGEYVVVNGMVRKAPK